MTPANEQEQAQVAELAANVQKATGSNVKMAFVDQCYTGEDASESAIENGIELVVVKHAEAKKASFFCRVDGSSNERSDGWEDAAD